MIEVFNSKSYLDIMCEYTAQNNCALVYFSNSNLQNKEEVFSFYEEFLPEDMLEILKQGRDNAVRFESTDAAILSATSWFPKRHQLPSDEYYWYSCVVDSFGDIIFENLSTEEEMQGG